MKTIDLDPRQGREWLVEAAMHRSVAAMILTRIDDEIYSRRLVGEDRERLRYSIEYHDTPRAVERVSIYLPSEANDPLDNVLLVVVSFALSLNGSIKAIANVRHPRLKRELRSVSC